MESETDRIETSRPLGLSLRDAVHLHEDIIRQLATFLDFQSLRQFRLLSREWNAACLPILMKRGTYNLSHKCHRNECEDLYKGATNYSSWKINHSVYESAELLHDNEMWGNVRSLTIHQRTPLSRKFHRWAWETIQTRCPNLQEITFIFEPIPNLQPETPNPYSERERKVHKDYKRAINEKPNASFPRISNLRNLTCVTFSGIYNKTTAYFAQHLLQACTPSLRRLYFCPIRQPRSDQPNVEALRIFKYLKQNPSLLKNLKSFGFNIEFYSANENEVLNPREILNSQLNFISFIQRRDYSPLQFNSENLTTLFWDSPFYRGDQLLPGVLTESIASSLVQLSLNGNVMNLFNRPQFTLHLVKISFPGFPRLRALKMGFLACRSLSVPKLVDSAPNLYVLEIKGEEGVPWRLQNDMSSFWRASEEKSVSNPEQPHLQLRIFCTDIPFDGLSTFERISSKFPNLEELRLGWVKEVDLDPFLIIVKSSHSKLQRLSWTLVKKEEMFTPDELFRHLLGVPELLPTLNVYSLGHEEGLFHNGYFEHSIIEDHDMKKSADILLRLLSNSNDDSCLRCINLLMNCLCCACQPTAEGESARNDCKKCYLHQFIRRHNLPIRIRSKREIEEMKEECKWNHRFASNWIYK
jgi:hypothetical protein